MQKLYKALLLVVILTLCNYSVVIAQPPCPPTSAIDMTFNPPPNPDGSFDAGTTVEICATITDFAGTNANWLHGFAFTFPPGWDVSSVVVINAPVACGTGGGEYIWMPNGIGTYGPGFYYDANIAGPQDGNPANNWGDTCGAEEWDFCIEITLGPPAGDPDFCGGSGNPLDDTSISPTLSTPGDGDTGSWGSASSCIPNNVSAPITMNCCDAISGISPGILDICENGSFCLFDELIAPPLEAIGVDGTWVGPAGWTSPDACGLFDPTVDPPGDYTYQVLGTDDCISTTVITMQFIDIGTIANIAHCDPIPLNLFTAASDPYPLPNTGTWSYPASAGGGTVPGGIIDPSTPDPQGLYVYEFYDANNCFTTATANIIFSTGSSGGCETWIDFCTEEAFLCPFDFLGCNPTAGGQWALYDAVTGNFVAYYPTHDVCIPASLFTNDMYITYILGSPPCSPAFTDLHVAVYDWVNTGLATTTSICVTDPPVLLESLLDPDPNGPVDVGYTWTDLTGNPVPLTNPLVPSAYPPNTVLQLNYTGGLNGTDCYNESLLSLTILPADADAGGDATIDVCESDLAFNMELELNGAPQAGGTWSYGGNPHGQFYNPAIDAPGVYTYTITTTCDSDISTLTVGETPQPVAGLPTVTTVCESDGFVDLTSLLAGGPVAGGVWTDQLTGNPVGNPMNVTGQCGPTQTTYVYTVTSGPCTNFTTLGLTIECAPDAGPDVVLDYCGDGSAINLPLILDPGADPGGTWSVPSPVILDPANSGVITYTTATNPLAACPTDVALYTLNIDPEIVITNVNTTCSPNQTEYITTFTISGGTPPYMVDGNPTGANFTSTATSAGVPYGFVVSDNGGCPDVNVNGPSPICTCIATAAFTSGNASICEGSCTNLTITSSGLTPPFTVVYTDGTTNTTLTGIGPNHIFSVCPTVTTNYSIVSVEDANCVGTPGAGSITVSVDPQPDAGADYAGDYCGDGSVLNLFTVLDPTADPGNFSPASTVTLLPANAGVFTYTTTVGNSCPEDQATYTINIDPEIVVSNIDASCLASQVEYITTFNVPFGADVLDNNSGLPLAVIGTSVTSAPIAAGTPYNFTVSMPGSTCPPVNVTGASPACSCPATADFTSASTTICAGSCTNLEITSLGTGPFDVVYSDGISNFNLNGIGANHIFSVCPVVNTTYSIVSVQDANCVGSAGFTTVTVGVETPPNAGPDATLPDYCGDGTSLNLFTLLDPGADLTGSFVGGNSITLNSANSGNYTYLVPGTFCPDDQATYSISIDDQLSISAVNASCLPSQLEYQVTFTISGGTGAGTYVVTSGNGNIVGTTFTSDPITAGAPFFFTIDDAGPCPAVTENGISPNCNCPATSSILTTNTTICEGSCTNIEFENAGNPPFDVVYTDGISNFNLNGIGANHIISVCPTSTTTYSLVSVNDADCTGSAFGSVTITVDQPNDAGNDVPDLVYCGDGSNIFLSPAPGEPVGGVFAPSASFPATVANSGVYTYTIGGNACPDDVALYTVTIDPEISITNVVAVCESNQLEYTVQFEITGGVAPYFVDGVQLIGNTFNSGLVDFATNPFYNYVVMDSGSCPDVVLNEPAPDCNCIAEGSFMGSTTICEGDCAQITFQGIGDAPFDITYEDSNGVPTTLLDINSGHIITVCPTAATTYTLTDVSDSYCVGVVSGSSVTVDVDTQLSAALVNEIIDANNENFQVVISVSGGDPATYSFSPPGGIYDNISGTYTSAPITCGSGYAITVSDAGVCPAVIIDSPFFDCGCVSDAGTLDTTPMSVCIDGTVTANHSGDEAMDGNDILEYILHDGMTGTIQNVLGRNYDGVFDMNNYGVVAGQTYCIVVAVGNADFFGHVMLNDPCVSISSCLPITIDPLPTASISGSASVCPGESVGLSILLTGTGPWDLTYAINGVDQTPISPTTSSYILNTNLPGDYTITAVSDANCVGFGQGVATVQNYVTPTATMSGNPDVCEGSGDGPIVNFTGDGPWTFEYTINGADPVEITTSIPTITIPATISGLYAISSLEGQFCTGTFGGTLTVNIIPQPSAIISGGGEVCDGDMATFEVVLTGQSPWTLLYTVDGLPQQPLNIPASPYQFDSGEEGDYVLTTLHDLGCAGQTIPSSASLVVNPLPTAEIEASTNAFCIGEEIELGFQLDGVPPFDVTYVLNSDTITMIGLLASTSELMTPSGQITAEIINVADGSNPTCESQPYSSVYVDASVLPNAPVLEDDSLCADHGPIRIGVPNAPGLSYTWTPEDRLSDPLASNPIFSPEQQSGPVAQTYTYVLTATNGDCSATDTMTVKVDPGPNARFGYTPDPVLTEDTEVFFKNYTTGASANMIYFWEFDSLDTSEQENPTYKFPDGVNEDYQITLTAIDAMTGCMDVHSEVLTVQPEMLVYVPNAFTPDGDALNDLWGPVMKNVDPNDYRLTVFDRYGTIIFTTRELGKKWNGSENGSDYFSKPGVYVWLIETKNSISLEEVDFKGKVTLIR